jgi:LmbE family N-acetylglucosaminyl deacetylase
MLTFQLGDRGKGRLQVLCLGAHSDDIEIGCGGTILQLLKSDRNITVYWVVLSANSKRKKEAAESANALLTQAGKKHVVIEDFRDGYFPYVGAGIKEYFETLKNEFSPDLIFTPCRNDLHQDHRLVSELTWNTYRNHVILEYEIPKYDGDLGSPNVYVHLDEEICKRKTRHILHHFKTQADNHWFAEETFLSVARLRGIESNAPSKYAEAFYGRKVVVRREQSERSKRNPRKAG